MYTQQFYKYVSFFCLQQNISREIEQIAFDIEDLERWRDRIFNAIHSGFIIDVIMNNLIKLKQQ